MNILLWNGSLRADSHNGRLLDEIAALLGDDAHITRLDGVDVIETFNEDVEGTPSPAVEQLRETVRAADVVITAVPEYNGSVPGGWKNAVDWLSRPVADNPLRGKPVVVLGVSTGLFGAVWAQADAVRILKILGADVIEADEGVPIGSASEKGELLDADVLPIISARVDIARERALATTPSLTP